jgi:hypothetical protein
MMASLSLPETPAAVQKTMRWLQPVMEVRY